MPLPKTKNVSRIIRFLKKEKPEMKNDQIVAIALAHSRKGKAKKDKKK